MLYGGVYAVNTNTNASGLWNTGGNWSSGVPGGSDNATVNHAMTINTNISTTSGDYTINAPTTDPVDGTNYTLSISGSGSNKGNFIVDANARFGGALTVSSHGILTIRAFDTLFVGSTTFANGSVVTIEPNGVLIINGNLTNNNNSDEIIVNGLIIVNGNVTGGNGSEINGTGGLSATGTVTTTGSGSVFGSTTDCNPGPCGLGGGVLPIELYSFTAYVSEGRVRFNWITLSEINNDYFTIERAGSDLEFEPLMNIEGAGNSRVRQFYSAIDNNPTYGVSYYRLKQTDFDGAYSYSEIESVRFIGQSAGGWSGFPNPTTGSIKLFWSDQTPVNARIVVSDLLGKKVLEVLSQAGEIDLTPVFAGVYLLQIVDLSGEVLTSTKVIKQ